MQGGTAATRGPSRSRLRAFGPALVAATLWGLSGTASQALFQRYGFPAPALVTLRMLVSGAILLAVLRPRLPSVAPARFLAFSVLGLYGVQLTFFLAIAYSNATTTTLLQSLSLPMMAGYEIAVEGRRPDRRWAAAVALAVTGTVLLILGRSGGLGLAVTPLGLAFGLLSAVTAAYYILAARPMIRSSGSWPTVTWGFLVGGAASLPLGLLSLTGYPGAGAALGAVVGLGGFVIVFGTLLAFGLFLTTLGPLTATEAGVAGTMEPIAAALASLAFLGVLLAPLQYLGGALVLVGVFLLAPASRRPAAPDVGARRRGGGTGPSLPGRGGG